MKTEDIDSLVLQHLAEVETSARRIRWNIQPLVGAALGAMSEQFCAANGWVGEFDFNDIELFLGPAPWRPSPKEEPNKYDAWFALECGEGDGFDDWEHDATKDIFWITRLVSAGEGQLGFRWGRNDRFGSRRQWRNYIADRARAISDATGFLFEEQQGTFFLQVSVSAEALAGAISEGRIEDALDPFDQSLKHLLSAEPEFSKLLGEMRRELVEER